LAYRTALRWSWGGLLGSPRRWSASLDAAGEETGRSLTPSVVSVADGPTPRGRTGRGETHRPLPLPAGGTPERAHTAEMPWGEAPHCDTIAPEREPKGRLGCLKIIMHNVRLAIRLVCD